MKLQRRWSSDNSPKTLVFLEMWLMFYSGLQPTQIYLTDIYGVLIHWSCRINYFMRIYSLYLRFLYVYQKYLIQSVIFKFFWFFLWHTTCSMWNTVSDACIQQQLFVCGLVYVIGRPPTNKYSCFWSQWCVYELINWTAPSPPILVSRDHFNRRYEKNLYAWPLTWPRY